MTVSTLYGDSIFLVIIFAMAYMAWPNTKAERVSAPLHYCIIGMVALFFGAALALPATAAAGVIILAGALSWRIAR